MAVLAARGLSEAEVRRHTPEWLETVIAETGRRERQDAYGRLLMAALTSYGPHSQQAGEALQELLDALRQDLEEGAAGEPVDHLLNPNAQTDWQALRGSGLLVQQEVKRDAAGG